MNEGGAQVNKGENLRIPEGNPLPSVNNFEKKFSPREPLYLLEFFFFFKFFIINLNNVLFLFIGIHFHSTISFYHVFCFLL